MGANSLRHLAYLLFIFVPAVEQRFRAAGYETTTAVKRSAPIDLVYDVLLDADCAAWLTAGAGSWAAAAAYLQRRCGGDASAQLLQQAVRQRGSRPPVLMGEVPAGTLCAAAAGRALHAGCRAAAPPPAGCAAAPGPSRHAAPKNEPPPAHRSRHTATATTNPAAPAPPSANAVSVLAQAGVYTQGADTLVLEPGQQPQVVDYTAAQKAAEEREVAAAEMLRKVRVRGGAACSGRR